MVYSTNLVRFKSSTLYIACAFILNALLRIRLEKNEISTVRDSPMYQDFLNTHVNFDIDSIEVILQLAHIEIASLHHEESLKVSRRERAQNENLTRIVHEYSQTNYSYRLCRRIGYRYMS